MKMLFLIVVVAFAFGCEGITYDVDAISLGNPDEPEMDVEGELDMDLPDSDVPNDADDESPDVARDLRSTDMADASDTFDAPDLYVSKCDTPQPLDPDRCNPTQTGECPGDGFCTLAVAAAPPPELLCVMRNLEGEGDVGTTCTSVSDCQEGLTCVDWGLQEADPRPKGCARFCEIETGAGCDEGEFCTTVTSQPPLEGIGYCTPACDPYDPDSCPTGQTCNVDYNFPIGTCEPHFRCVSTEDFAMEGEECGPGRMVASCAEDLVCYQVQVADFRCVVPCQSDADCGGETCLDPQGDWQLRYCDQGT